MTVIETSKLLSECALDLESFAVYCAYAGHTKKADKYVEWAAAIRSVIIPEPIGGSDEKPTK